LEVEQKGGIFSANARSARKNIRYAVSDLQEDVIALGAIGKALKLIAWAIAAAVAIFLAYILLNLVSIAFEI